eukprot:c34192_g1_i1 orf=223-1101(-)
MQDVVAGAHLKSSARSVFSAHPALGSPSARLAKGPIFCSRSHGGLATTCSLAAASYAEAKSYSSPVSDNLSMELHVGSPFQVVIREATLADYWEVADTHCGAFIPELVFPMDAIMRLDRVVAMVGGLPLPRGCQRKYLVAVSARWHNGQGHGGLFEELLHWKLSEDESQTDYKLESVLGVLTVDTLADFLPRRKSTGFRRNGIAYISNVAVRRTARRKGIAKRLVQEAEMTASLWGCRSIALHCDKINTGALALYVGAGYKAVKVPADAKWPQPKAASGTEFGLMLKCLRSI